MREETHTAKEEARQEAQRQEAGYQHERKAGCSQCVGPSSLLGLLFGLLALGAVFAAPAQALQIEGFQTTTSSSLAGDHPDLHTAFALKDAGAPEVAKNIAFNAPTGVFGNPSVLTECIGTDFALQQCPPNAQAGLVTLRANYEGNPNYLLGTAPIYRRRARGRRGRPLRLRRRRPSTSRSRSRSRSAPATDYGLRFTVSGITQLTPLASADLTFWGFPAESAHDAQRFPKGTPGSPAGCPGLADTSCIAEPARASVPVLPFTGQPLRLRHADADHARRRDLPAARRLRPCGVLLSADHGLRSPDLQARRTGAADQRRGRLRLRP